MPVRWDFQRPQMRFCGNHAEIRIQNMKLLNELKFTLNISYIYRGHHTDKLFENCQLNDSWRCSGVHIIGGV